MYKQTVAIRYQPTVKLYDTETDNLLLELRGDVNFDDPYFLIVRLNGVVKAVSCRTGLSFNCANFCFSDLNSLLNEKGDELLAWSTAVNAVEFNGQERTIIGHYEFDMYPGAAQPVIPLVNNKQPFYFVDYRLSDFKTYTSFKVTPLPKGLGDVVVVVIMPINGVIVMSDFYERCKKVYKPYRVIFSNANVNTKEPLDV